MGLFAVYIFTIIVLFILGLVTKINSKTPEEDKKGKKLMLISALMFVVPIIIVGTVCGLMIAGN